MSKNEKNQHQHQHLNKAVSADPGWAQHATRTENPSTPRVGRVASAALQCAQGDTVPTPTRLRVAAPTPENVCSTALPAGGGGKKTAQFFTVCRSVLGHQLPIDISLPPASTTYQWAPVSVGSCRSVCRARCRSSSEVNVPVHDLQAVAVLRLRATVLAIFTRNTLAHPPLPRVHRAPIGPSSTQRDTTESKRDNRGQLLTQHRDQLLTQHRGTRDDSEPQKFPITIAPAGPGGPVRRPGA